MEIIPELKFTYMSPSVEDIVGYTVEEHIKNPMLPLEIIHPDDHEIQFSKIKGEIDSSKFFQVRMKHKNGYYYGWKIMLSPHIMKGEACCN